MVKKRGYLAVLGYAMARLSFLDGNAVTNGHCPSPLLIGMIAHH
ncbi:hypothetical protein [Marinobacter sp. LV10R510-11A]|nr:hypothetical protein [Marinobacter sp. LV10R510-11A]